MHPPMPSRAYQMLCRVRETSPSLVLGTTLLRLIRALLPLAMLWVSRLVLDAVVARITHKSGNLQQVWKRVALELGLANASDALGRVNSPLGHRVYPAIGKIFQNYLRYLAFNDENIGLGKISPLRDGDGVESADDNSLAKNVIGRLSNGYDQMVGRRFEAGVDLSRGAWQKFALAGVYMHGVTSNCAARRPLRRAF